MKARATYIVLRLLGDQVPQALRATSYIAQRLQAPFIAM